jgi:hypothetical protein
LGVACFQQLIQLGYWKKCLFALDYDNALKVADTFSDFSNWKFIFLTNRLRLVNNQLNNINDSDMLDVCKKQENKIRLKLDFCFEVDKIFESWPFVEPTTDEEATFVILTYEEYIWKVV